MNESSKTSFSDLVDYSSTSGLSWASSWYEDYTVTRNVLVGLAYGSISLVTIVGNLMVIVAFAKDVRINRKIANWYIVNLSMADGVVGLVLAINLTWMMFPYGEWPFGEIPCKIFLLVDYTVVTNGAFNIIFISLDRYWLLTKKLAYPKYQTKRTATALITFGWAFCFMFFGVITFGWIPLTGFEEEINYSCNCELEATYNFEFQVFLIGLIFVLPLLTIVCLNSVVYRNIRERSKGFVQSKPVVSSEGPTENKRPAADESPQDDRDKNGKTAKRWVSIISLHVLNRATPDQEAVTGGKPSGDTKRADFNRHRKAAITLAVLVSIFIVCWVPYYITVILGTLCESCVPDKAWEFTNGFLWCNSTINPFLYAAMNPHFRQNFIKFLGLSQFMKKKDDSAPSTKVQSSKDGPSKSYM